YWYGYQLVVKILELLLCAFLGYAATQPLRHNDPTKTDVRWKNLCCCFTCRRRVRDTIDNETCSDMAYGFRNENFNTSLDFTRAWSQEVSTFRSPAVLRNLVESRNPTPTKPVRASILTNTLQALSSLSSRHSRFLGSLKD